MQILAMLGHQAPGIAKVGKGIATGGGGRGCLDGGLRGLGLGLEFGNQGRHVFALKVGL